MKALRYERSLPRFAAARLASMTGAGRGASCGPLGLVDDDEVALPGADWVRLKPRLAGICGSDLATIDARSSRWFEPIVSFPFVPGHEIVADAPQGRVVVEPVLGCASRSIQPVCTACRNGDLGRCERITFGSLAPGLQSGFCCDVGGGWATSMVAHPSQLHSVPDGMSDEAAVMVEPTACAVHGALAAGSVDGGVVVVLGAGTLGLGVTAALLRWNRPGQLLVVAKHPEQRRSALALGADQAVVPEEAVRAVRRAVGTMAVGDGEIERLTGGCDVTIDCVGSSKSIAEALRFTKPGGRIVRVGMPGEVRVDLTPLWHREISLMGAYAYGTEPFLGDRRTFDAAFELVAAASLDRFVSATYPLDRYEDALRHAANAGRRGSIKIAFDLRSEKHR